MSISCLQKCTSILPLGMTRLFPALIVMGTIWLTTPATIQAAPADDQYLKIYRAIENADALATAGKTAQAITNYQQADKALKEFRRTFPNYSPKLVGYRLNYVSDKIARLNAPAPDVSTNAAVKITDPNQPQWKLSNPGAEPRTVLRVQPQAGDKQTVVMSIKMGMGIELPGQPEPQEVKLPAMKMTLNTEVQSVLENGDIVYSIAYGDVEVAEDAGTPEMAQALKGALGDLSGLTGMGTNTSRGFNKGFQMNVPADANPQTKQMFEQMGDSLKTIANPLPEEAVGLGAKWESKLLIKSQGMQINQTTHSELVGLTEGQATFKISLTQTAANQKISNPAMPGLKLDLTKMDGSGTGESTIDLKQILPTKATMNSKTDLAMAMYMGNQKQTMKMAMTMELTLQNK